MKAVELLQILAAVPEDAEIAVACQGYTNYDFKGGKIEEESETNTIYNDGVLFIIDSCALEKPDGTTI